MRDLEGQIGAALDVGDFAGAAHATVAGYGAEILGFLLAVQRDESAARDCRTSPAIHFVVARSRSPARTTTRWW